MKINLSSTVKLAARFGVGHSASVSLSLTLWLFAASVIVCVFAGWRGAAPVDLRRPRLTPWRFVMLLAGALAFLLLIHLGALFGLGTGR